MSFMCGIARLEIDYYHRSRHALDGPAALPLMALFADGRRLAATITGLLQTQTALGLGHRAKATDADCTQLLSNARRRQA